MRVFLCLAVVAGCSTQRSSTPPPPASATPPAPVAVVDAGSVVTPSSSSSAAAAKEPEPEPEPEPTFEQMLPILGIAASACPPSLPNDSRVRCLFDQRYAGDAKA